MALGELTPPAEIAPAHADAVAALTRSLDAIPTLVSALRAAETQGEIDAAVNGSAFGDAQPRVVAACVALEGLATARELPQTFVVGKRSRGSFAMKLTAVPARVARFRGEAEACASTGRA